MLSFPSRSREILAASPFANMRKFPEKQELARLREIPVQPDPLPQHTLNYRKTALGIAGITLGGLGTGITLGGLGVWYTGRQLYNLLPSWRGSTSTPPVSSTAPNSQGFSLTKVLSSIPGRLAFLLQYFRGVVRFNLDEGIRATTMAAQEKKRGRLDLRTVYKGLHQEGIQGQGMKVGVIDIFPNLEDSYNQNKNKMPVNAVLKALSKMSHGTVVANIIRKAAPKAEILEFSSASLLPRLDYSALVEVLQKSREQPEELTSQNMRKALAPYIADLSTTLMNAVDSGISVVNVSIAPEDMLLALDQQVLMSIVNNMRKADESHLQAAEKDKAFNERLNALVNRQPDLDDRLKPIHADLMAIYQPWYDALAYAAEKNVLVVVAAGNSGEVPKAAYNDGLSHINPLGLKHQSPDHVLVVGSTSEQGLLSDFSSEYNNRIKPDIAANGSGQLNSQGLRPSVPSNLLRINPTLPLWLAEDYKNPHGTSIAAPDITGLYVMMQSARKKDGKPPLSVREFYKVLSLAAQSVEMNETTKKKFQEALASKADEKVEEQKTQGDAPQEQVSEEDRKLKNALEKSQEQVSKQQMEEAIARRVGPYGTVAGRRRHAVALARAYRTEQERWSSHQFDLDVD